MRNQIRSESDSGWDDVKEFLDDAVARLKPADRDALTLRYFQNREVPEVAAALGISPLAAQKRVSRAVERLRDLFARRGIATSSDALSSLLLTHAVTSAPEALSGSISASALSTAKTIASLQTLKGAATIMAMTKAKAAVLVIAAGMIITAGVAVPILVSKAPSPPLAASPATVPTTNPDAWKPRFREVYSLQPGQVAKRIELPHIPERASYFGSLRPDDIFRQQPPVASYFRWFDGEAHLSYGQTETPFMLAELMVQCAQVWPQDTDLTRDVLMMEAPGDWIVRDDSTPQEKITAFLQAVMGPGIALTLSPMEREVIVVTGNLEYKRVSNSKSKLIGDGKRMLGIVLFPNYERVQASNRHIAQTQIEFLMMLGEIFNQPIVVEAQLGEQRSVELLLDRSIDSYLRSKQPVNQASMDEILGLVTDQTSLQFTKARRTVPTWKLTQSDK